MQVFRQLVIKIYYFNPMCVCLSSLSGQLLNLSTVFINVLLYYTAVCPLVRVCRGYLIVISILLYLLIYPLLCQCKDH